MGELPVDDNLIRQQVGGRGVQIFLREFWLFGLKQAWACLYGGVMLALLIGSKFVWQPDWVLARYDFLFLAALTVQAALLLLKLETLAEARVIFLFHGVGTLMELFKTAAGSWEYPEEAFFRIGGVPLFSGFLYACVGSYLARITRIFDQRYAPYPPQWACLLLAAMIYGNFFLHHYWFDLRWLLFGLVALMFGRTTVWFTIDRQPRRMPLLLGFFLVACFIWLAENIGTNTRTWAYAGQAQGWHLVSAGKLGSWFLLMIVSFVLVSLIHRPRPPDAGR